MRDWIKSASKFSAVLLGLLSIQAQASTGFISQTGGFLDSSASDQLYGWIFMLNSPIDVSALGVLDTGSDGLSVAHEVGIYRVSDQSLVASVTVSAGTSGTLDTGYRYAALGSDVFLAPGQYATVMTMPAFNDDHQILDASTVTTAPEISYDISANYFGSTIHYPGKTGLYSLGLFGPNFEFTAATVPEPSSYALMLGGLGILGCLARRRTLQSIPPVGPVGLWCGMRPGRSAKCSGNTRGLRLMMKHPFRLFVAMVALASPFAASSATFYQDLHDFAGGAGDGDTAYSDLVADSQGRLYGTTYYGGNFGGGTLYRVTLPTSKTGPATIEILHSFQVSEGVTPVGGVLIGADGGLYGTTNAGGAHNGGTVYRVDPASFALSVLHDFNPGATPPDGGASQAGLVAGPNGLLYGTTTGNGPLGGGTVFAISPEGDGVAYAVIYAFGATGDANHPFGRLVATGKNLFGTTFFGGQFGLGTVFELSLAKGGKWSESGLYSFGTNGADPIFPPNGLVMAKSGLLYGCAGGGSFAHGAVYSITPAKAGAPLEEAVIFNFGANPEDPFPNGSCGLTIDKTGRLVGTTNLGGANSSGTLFTLTPSGGTWTLAVPYNFGIQANGDAVQPAAAVIGVPNGFYVGTTPVGGIGDKGAVYRVRP